MSQRSPRGRKRLVVILVILVGLWIRSHVPFRPLPDLLTGTWETSNTQYAGRQIRLSTDAVAFLVDRDSAWLEYPVRTYRRSTTSIGARFQIEFEAPDGVQWLDLLFDSAVDQIQFTNRPEVTWQRMP